MAFAIKAHGAAEVMHASNDYESPPMDGIWGRIEYPTVLSHRKIDKVERRLAPNRSHSNVELDHEDQ